MTIKTAPGVESTLARRCLKAVAHHRLRMAERRSSHPTFDLTNRAAEKRSEFVQLFFGQPARCWVCRLKDKAPECHWAAVVQFIKSGLRTAATRSDGQILEAVFGR